MMHAMTNRAAYVRVRRHPSTVAATAIRLAPGARFILEHAVLFVAVCAVWGVVLFAALMSLR